MDVPSEKVRRVDLQFALDLPHKFSICLEGVAPLTEKEHGFPYEFDENPNARKTNNYFYAYLAKINAEKLDNPLCLKGPILLKFYGETNYSDESQMEAFDLEKLGEKPHKRIGRLGMYTGLEGNRATAQPSVLLRKRQFPFIEGLGPEKYPWYELDVDASFRPRFITEKLTLCVSADDSRIEATKWRYFESINVQK